MYEIGYDAGVAKDLRKLAGQARERVQKRIDKLAKEPRPHGVVKLTNEDELYRIRVGNCRVVYYIFDDEELVYVMRVRPRDKAYKQK